MDHIRKLGSILLSPIFINFFSNQNLKILSKFDCRLRFSDFNKKNSSMNSFDIWKFIHGVF
jgi:hypothetical protein